MTAAKVIDDIMHLPREEQSRVLNSLSNSPALVNGPARNSLPSLSEWSIQTIPLKSSVSKQT